MINIFFEERRPREGRDARDTCLPRKSERESGGLNRRESGIGVSWGGIGDEARATESGDGRRSPKIN